MKEGSIVKLRSGGPLMTVTKVFTLLDGPTAHCVWFDKNAVVHEKNFIATSLRIVDLEEST